MHHYLGTPYGPRLPPVPKVHVDYEREQHHESLVDVNYLDRLATTILAGGSRDESDYLFG